jgi:glycolate oxidase FAD binding subunit
MPLIEQRVRSIVGADGFIDVDEQGCVAVAPRSEEECALILAAAHQESWRVRFDGRGSWIKPDAPTELAISTRLLEGATDLSPADMVLTARAGTRLEDLQNAAADEGMWIALDPPGAARSIGSIVATGTVGPLRNGFGTVKSRVLGLTLITADGRIVTVGGRVVKNVAGFDITSLTVGSFGAFGLITSANIRLNALPKTDITLTARAPLALLLNGAQAILSTGQTPAAFELFSPEQNNSSGWTLAIRLLGSEATVGTDRAAIIASVPQIEFDQMDRESSCSFWASASTRATERSTTVRMGSQPSELARALALMSEQLGDTTDGFVAVSVMAGVTRWSSDASIQQLQNLRLLAARQNWPVTLERAPWEVRQTVGHYGAYREGVGKLVTSLRHVFDPRDGLVCPLDGTP